MFFSKNEEQEEIKEISNAFTIDDAKALGKNMYRIRNERTMYSVDVKILKEYFYTDAFTLNDINSFKDRLKGKIFYLVGYNYNDNIRNKVAEVVYNKIMNLFIRL